MGERSAPNLKRYLLHVAVATAVVTLLPVALVSELSSLGLVRSALLSVPLAVFVSLGASSLGSAWWKKRPNSHDLVFSDLMIWGWLRRLRTERRLSRAVELLGNQKDQPLDERVELFELLANALEARDAYTHGHTRRVTRHAAAIAERMGLSREQVTKVRTAAAIHDIGKLHTPRDVLNKPGRLTDAEFDVIKRHPVDGARMAEQLRDDEITAMVMHHHERLDGTGYPSGLAGEQIPLGARIIAVADTFDAITSTRAYRGATSHRKALGILAKEAGTQLDPDALRAFCSHYSGRRGVAVSSLLSSVPSRLLPWPWPALSSVPLTKSFAALAVAGALGGSAAELAKSRFHPSGGRQERFAQLALQAVSTGPGAASARRLSVTQHLRAGSLLPADANHAEKNARRRYLPHRGPAKPVPTQVVNGGTGGSTGRSGPAVGGSASSDQGGQTSPRPGSGGAGGTPPSSTPSSPTTTPSATVTSPSVTVTTPSATVTSPSVTVTTPSATVTSPSVTVTTPSVTATMPSLPITTPSLPATNSIHP